ncbi:Riboflavin transporter [Rhodobacteraceae bacterium THAF1]|uniref:DMT family transporter n=1 Tax=Palleronia sp. THAF1 TaxID=2587842 RepID=UPI000F41255D|nr:DMT family transporter [Palleronia sp. THAF1]QFU08422.1 Riboflavin transporter [Palleronia sp. THAF1]VDC29244.1 Riboflavin transporter [Rhodobacteraceae bacterium THAF1]
MNPENMRAMLFMVLSMALFATEDFFIKIATAGMPAMQVLFVLSVGGAFIFGSICLARGMPLISRDLLLPGVAARNGAEIVATVCFITALSLIPLSLAAAILQATPIFVTAGAAIWLGETVGWRRWLAVLVGLFGVLLILRPGFEGFRPPALLALVAAMGLATRDVVSRRIPRRISTVQLSFWAYALLSVVSAVLMVPGGVSLDAGVTAWRAAGFATVLGVFGYAVLTAATRLGDVSAVIPFRYTRLIFALAIGTTLLGERPDALTLIGAAIVVSAGLYAIWRERQVRRIVPFSRTAR